MQDINQTKERILSIIQNKGPSLPVQIAHTINISPLFTSVFLSELYEDAKLRMSHMKIGSSSLYLIPGQEAQLENFTEHLDPREKQAFFLIKKELVLEDDKQLPVMRVALRAIKDFAVPFKLTINGSEKIFWRYYLLTNEETDSKLQRIFNPLAPAPEKKKEISEPIISLLTTPSALPSSAPQIEAEPENSVIAKSKRAKKKKSRAFEFPDKLKEYLLSKDIEILETLVEKKKEFAAKIRADTLFGKQEYYLIAKDKKKINEADIALALQKAHLEKMPSLIVSPGEIEQKALNYIKEWRNLVKFEKLKI